MLSAVAFVMVPAGTAIAEFWTWFCANAAQLQAMSNAADPLWETALSRLHLVHPNLRFEISEPVHGRCELVITAEGDQTIFPIAEALVAAAPSSLRWTFIALKPAMGFDFVTTYEGVAFDSKATWFLPLESSDRPSGLGLRIGIPGLNDEMRRVAGSAVQVILATGLGERSLAMDVQHIECAEAPGEPQKAGYIELSELPAYIAWRKRKLANA